MDGSDQSLPSVSVVIPVHNRAHVLKRALDSVAAQTFRDFEVVVVDDGSTDEPGRVAGQTAIGPLRVIRHPQNLGAAAARNTGIRAAKGRFVAFLDSDDAWHPDKLMRQVAALSGATPAVKACSTGFELHRSGRNVTVQPRAGPAAFRSEILFGCTICPGTTLMVERAAFDAIGVFDEELRRLEDWDLLLRFVERFDVLLLPDALATIHADADVADSGRPRGDAVPRALARIAEKHTPRLRDRGGSALRKFRSTLLFETSAEMFRQRRLGRAMGYVLASFYTYPLRNAASYRSLRQSLVSMVRCRGQAGKFEYHRGG